MDENQKQFYSQELQGAIQTLKQQISNAQTTMGVLEAFLYLLRKESEKPVENETNK